MRVAHFCSFFVEGVLVLEFVGCFVEGTATRAVIPSVALLNWSMSGVAFCQCRMVELFSVWVLLRTFGV